MNKFLNKILCGDCIEVFGKIREPFTDLIFADPPFNIGYKYDKYYDKVKSKNYIAWTREWMRVCMDVLKPDGSFYVAIGDDYAAHIRLIADELGLTTRNWIIWHYTFGQQTKNKFARSHTHIFYFVKDKNNFTFNDHSVRVPSDRQLTYNDKRANPRGKMPDDVWCEYSRVCGTFNEREGWHPCQMPENLLTRIITVSSNPGDLVLDPFSGSGTTAAAALKAGRNYCGIELSEEYVDNTERRLKKINTQDGKLPVSSNEFGEIKRLLLDMSMSSRDILSSDKLFGIFITQLEVRINGTGKVKKEQIRSALEVLAD